MNTTSLRARLLPCVLLLLTSSGLPSAASAAPQHEALHRSAALDEATDELLRRIRSEGDKVKPRVFELLGERRTADALDALKRGTTSLSKDNKVKAIFIAFRHFVGAGELEREAIDFLVKESTSKNETFRHGATLGLMYFGAAAYDELEYIARKGKDAACRRGALSVLVTRLAERAEPDDLKLVLELYRFPATGTRTTLVALFRRFVDPVSIAIFSQHLKKSSFDLDVKLAIVEAFASFVPEDPKVAEDVAGLLSYGMRSKDPLVALASLQGLEARGYAGHLRDLERLEGTKDPSLRKGVFAALSRLLGSDPAWEKKMLTYATSRDEERRRASIEPLGRLANQAALDALHVMVSDAHLGVRRDVYRILSWVRRSSSIPFLIDQIAKEDTRLKGALRRVLVRITGEDHGYSQERWAAWWTAHGATFQVPTLTEVVERENKRRGREKGQITEASFYGMVIESDRVAWVLDISGSMEERTRDGDTRMQAMKAQVIGALEEFPDGDLFNLVFFSTTVTPMNQTLVRMDRKTRREATDFVEELRAGGATAIYDGLEAAISDPRVDTIYLLSDGDATTGVIQDPPRIRAAVRSWAQRRNLTVHCVAVGTDHDLLRGLAQDTGGEYRRVD